MNRSDRLTPVANLAHRKQSDAAQALGQAQLASTSEDRKLQDLQNYRAEYIADFQRRGKAGVSGSALQQFQHFLTKLDDAIAQQQKRLQGAQLQVREKTDAWQDRLSRAKALQNTVDKFRKDETVQQEKRDQRTQDDRSALKITQR